MTTVISSTSITDAINNAHSTQSQVNNDDIDLKPLHWHVHRAVEKYFLELEGEDPSNLYETILQQVERPMLEVVLEKTRGNQSKTAVILGINRGTLRKKLKTYHLM